MIILLAALSLSEGLKNKISAFGLVYILVGKVNFVFKLHEFNPFVQLTKEQRVLQTEVLFENFELIHFNCLHVIETLVS